MSGGSGDLQASRPLTRRRKLAYSLIATLLFFVVLESTLAIVGVEPAMDTGDPFVGFDGSSPLFVPSSDDPSRMVTATNKLDWFNPQSFARRKPDGTRRIFCLGGSTTYGRPYDDLSSFVGWLRELLPRIEPGEDWEVINAGGISYASYRVARLVEELGEYEPDFLIVYTGQNEFLEDRTYRELRQASPLRRQVTSVLAHLRTAAVLQRLIGPRRGRAGAEGRYELPAEVDAALDHTVGPTSYERDDRQRERVLEHFEINLTRIVHFAERADAQLVLVTPASNLPDCSPFKSRHAGGLTAERLKRWEGLYEAGRRLDRLGRFDEALVAYRDALKLDSRYAELQWRLGRVLAKLDRPDEARRALGRAIDEDICPLRAVGEIPRIIRRTARRWDVPLVDFELLLAERCQERFGHRSPGEQFFLDHVHPTVATNGLLASGIIDRLIDEGFMTQRGPLTEQLLEEVAGVIGSRIDRRKHAIALRNLAKVLNWAGKHIEAGSLALRAVEVLPDDPESLLLSAAYLAETGRRGQAIEHYRRALRHRPGYAEAHQMLGAALVDAGELEAALVQFTALAGLRPSDAHAWQMIGAIHVERRRFAEALPHFEKAVGLASEDADIHYNLANALGHLGRRKEAIRHYLQAVALNPDDADAHNNLGVMLVEEKRPAEAARHFREVLRIRPDDEMAAASLRDIER